MHLAATTTADDATYQVVFLDGIAAAKFRCCTCCGSYCLHCGSSKHMDTRTYICTFIIVFVSFFVFQYSCYCFFIQQLWVNFVFALILQNL